MIINQLKITLVVSNILKTAFFVSTILLVSCSSTRSPVESKTPKLPPTQVNLKLNICPMSVSNAPPSIDRKVQRLSAVACVNDVEILVAPAPNACLSSGFGFRHGRQHDGLDYQSKPAGTVIAAAKGTVINKVFRIQDYGNWIIIDHGNGVYSSYAHLKSVSSKISINSKVKRGQVLGQMGETGGAAQAIHLHFEVRKGDYDNPKKWWGLTALNSFKLPEKC